MAHSIVTDVCEGIADCVDACPVACIDQGKGKNKKGTDFYWINFDTCIDCGICLQVCPIEGAIVAEERPDLQKTPELDQRTSVKGTGNPLKQTLSPGKTCL